MNDHELKRSGEAHANAPVSVSGTLVSRPSCANTVGALMVALQFGGMGTSSAWAGAATMPVTKSEPVRVVVVVVAAGVRVTVIVVSDRR